MNALSKNGRARIDAHAGGGRLGLQGARALALAIACALAPALLTAQAGPSKFDRTKAPEPLAPRPLNVPRWTQTTLPDGAELIVSQKHDLPLVAFSIDFVGGADQYEPAGKTGLANITASMMSEGTKSRTGDQLSDDLELLGTRVGIRVGDESGSLGFTSTTANFPKVLAILADMLENPSFPPEALERLRARTLVGLTQAKDQPTAIAANVFGRVLYGTEHPYGRFMTEDDVKGITREDVVGFHDTYFRPGRAIITVVGDIDPAAVKATVQEALAGWPDGGSRPSFDYPPVPAPRPTTIYLVDKPGAPQSVFAIGLPGPKRDTPDYYAIEVMNTILGGLFQSRLNHDIREVKGYSYGVRSSFAFGKGPGPFYAGGSIVTEKTDSALIAFMAHLKGVQGSVPFTDDEIAQAKASLVESLPQAFSSVNATAGAIGAIYLEGLPQDFYQTMAQKVDAVTRDDLVRVAKKYIDLGHLDIVIVGDRASIEGPLEATAIAPIVHLDVEGKPVN
jgi:zinc protease